MKLLRISIHGFKSFADKINIDIKDGITGIVGPNGSGKSNIVDAVRWVLGEQSLNNIRVGSNSSDVIFCGSKTRAGSSRAWVCLTFDNSDHYLKSDLNEIEIKRIVYSSGENEYYLNNEQVRLKDITDLFIDSGSSVNSLSIISQGKISEIINGRPEEKRSIIESAAGVLKYKKRKEESLRKLDKTSENLSKVNLVIDELFINLEPLKEQAQTATQFLKYKTDLAKTEIALIAKDIKINNEDYQKLKKDKERLDNELLQINNSNLIDNSKIDNIKIKLLSYEDEINIKSDELYKITKEVSILQSEKQIMLERKKYDVDNDKINNNLIELKEKDLSIQNNIKQINNEISININKLDDLKNENKSLLEKLENTNRDKNILINNLQKTSNEITHINNNIEIINSNIENNSKLPYAVKCILNNDRLQGIHDILANIIETDESYTTAIDIALGFNANVIITNDEKDASSAVSYLKSNNLGRATFFPLNIIRPKIIDNNTLYKIKDDSSFIGIASDLVTYDNKYKNIVLNQLGTIIVIDNLYNANRIGKLIKHMYRIVTLDGDVIAAGGSITGGSSKNSSGLLNQKKELDNFLKQKNIKISLKKEQDEALNNILDEIKVLEAKLFASNNELNSFKELISRKTNELDNLNELLTSIQNEINGNNGLLNNAIDQEIEKILERFYEVSSLKDKLSLELSDLKSNKSDLQSEISELELLNKNNNSMYNKKLTELKNIEISLNKIEQKLDTLLLRLNEEYGMTYEKASAEYFLEIDEDVARSNVGTLKRSIKSLGDVNTGSIAEYERINSRYLFLKAQQDDLNSAIMDIMKIINDLDKTMIEKLKITFTELNHEFAQVFKKLFKGGNAELILLNPDDLLNSGVEIKAIPPGKEIKNIKQLSGGESTLTAIALLFAVLNIRTVPFCVFDEIEAALDDVNVDMFGSYLKELKMNTQFIIVTHKKRTMEYTNNLYGITMQESGVSKLVSVRLKD